VPQSAKIQTKYYALNKSISFNIVYINIEVPTTNTSRNFAYFEAELTHEIIFNTLAIENQEFQIQNDNVLNMYEYAMNLRRLNVWCILNHFLHSCMQDVHFRLLISTYFKIGVEYKVGSGCFYIIAISTIR